MIIVPTDCLLDKDVVTVVDVEGNTYTRTFESNEDAQVIYTAAVKGGVDVSQWNSSEVSFVEEEEVEELPEEKQPEEKKGWLS